MRPNLLLFIRLALLALVLVAGDASAGRYLACAGIGGGWDTAVCIESPFD